MQSLVGYFVQHKISYLSSVIWTCSLELSPIFSSGKNRFHSSSAFSVNQRIKWFAFFFAEIPAGLIETILYYTNLEELMKWNHIIQIQIRNQVSLSSKRGARESSGNCQDLLNECLLGGQLFFGLVLSGWYLLLIFKTGKYMFFFFFFLRLKKLSYFIVQKGSKGVFLGINPYL